jgi:adenosine deaminase
MKNEEIIRNVPKVMLHDHLDGGLRPQTVIDLAKEINTTNFRPQIQVNLANGFTAELTKETLSNIFKVLNILVP